MAQDKKRQDLLPGIKLFGKTITLQNTISCRSQVKEESNKLADHHDHEQTVEKRPDKIISCPRCKSMETKFCYFNNYKLNQPRHFCKGCQRYWTAGGALRNVPVGAGRRKNKLPNCHGLIGLTKGTCLYDTTSGVVHQFDLDGMMTDWQMAAAAQGGLHHVFPMIKRRRSDSGGQTCT